MTREEAIKWFEWNVTSITVPDAQEAFGLAISALREQPRWISVEAGLPKLHETVLVIRRNQRRKLSVECGYYMGNGNWQVGTRLTRPVTHWMPLPVPPPGVLK